MLCCMGLETKRAGLVETYVHTNTRSIIENEIKRQRELQGRGTEKQALREG
jgi:hypothetical protein